MSGARLAKEEYIFGQSQTTAIRLNYQHFVHHQLLGWNLHPSLPKDGSPRIADIGAGSGIWAQEVAQALPQATVDAFDISLEQFPPSAWMPKNLRFIEQDCHAPFPKEYLGQYDIVNVRFFLVILVPSTLENFIRNMKTLLKPGGYFQWYEPDMDTMVGLSPPDMKIPAIDRLIPIAKKPTPDTDHSWVKNADKKLEGCDFNVTKFERFVLPDSLLPLFTQVQLMGYNALAEGLQRGGRDDEARKIQEHLNELNTEYRKGGVMKFDFVCAIARN